MRLKIDFKIVYAFVIPKALIRSSCLLVNIIPHYVVSVEVSATTSCLSRIVSVNFSCAMSDHLFNSIGIIQNSLSCKVLWKQSSTNYFVTISNLFFIITITQNMNNPLCFIATGQRIIKRRRFLIVLILVQEEK